MIVALLLTGVWIAQGIGTSNLVSLALQRSSGLTFTLGEWLSRQWLWLDVLFPTWYLLLFVVGVMVGLLDQRTRFVTALFAGITIAWALAFPTGSFIHDFWNLSSLAVGLVGIAALADRIWQLLSPRGARIAAGIGLALAAVAFWGVSSGPFFFDYFEAPSEAGGLVHDNEPPPTQQVAWTTTPVAVAYWLSWYWDLPARQLGEEQLSAIDADDLVLIRTDLLPDWIEPEAASRALAERGKFALVNAEALRPSPIAFSPVSPAGADESHDP
jgi:hypothetical protein